MKEIWQLDAGAENYRICVHERYHDSVLECLMLQLQ